MTATLDIQPGDLNDERVLRLLADHLQDMFATSPAESVHALDVSGLSVPEITFWTVAHEGEIVGCVALKELDPGHGELKSMRTDASVRGRGLGAGLLEHVLAEAIRRDYRRVSLETGTEDFFAPARALYAKYGFVETGPFASYALDPNSVFMTIELDGR
ncbi:GNAT family N-acetyltransferase [Agromyces sp. LHK192]|uniref:GNAT family N-acetyltransferase n=1 Tax=Agromyces sp. LHK192 TaxID=2498704 RepID=UPI001F0C976F|nr:GNAT family N-acetyltransferase [Agromyces sp. LHK192]